jgi:hypothetical protein
MAEPLREQVLVAVVAKLQAMVGNRFWGTPYPTPPRVERPLKVPENPTQLPLLVVLEGSLDGPGSTVKIEVTAGGEVGLRHEFKVVLFGWIAAHAGVLASTWRQRLWQDCLVTLMADNTLDGLVMAIEWAPEMETNEGAGENIALFAQPLNITFHETVTTD